MPARIALSEVLAALSYALDLTDGQSAGHTVRACLIGMRLAHEAGLEPAERSALYYALLLKDAGCSSNAARLCQLFGTDDRTLKPRLKAVDLQRRLELALQTFRTTALGGSLTDKLRHTLGIARAGDVLGEIMTLRCERGADIARRLGFPEESSLAIRHIDEHWNGRGHPDGLSGGAIPLMARIACLAQTFELFNHRSGLAAALRMVRRRRSRWFDPDLADLVLGWRRDYYFWDRLAHGDLASEVMGEEPASHARSVSDQGLDTIALAFADIIDAKSPYTCAHSRNVAAYSVAIARQLGLDAAAQRRVQRAGLLHDIGKLGVSNSILDKPAALDSAERAAVERHPFHTWEILSRVPAFREFAWPAALHHERLDGTGYPWRLTGNRLDITARILGVADVYEALTADRPYRTGLPWVESSRILWKGRGSWFDPAVLDALRTAHESAGGMPGSDVQVTGPTAAA